MLSTLLEQTLGAQAQVYMGESVFLVHVRIKCFLSSDELCDRAAANGILVFPIHKTGRKNEGYAHIALSCCEVPVEKFPEAVELLLKTLSDGA